jgi:hypothetical protein
VERPGRRREGVAGIISEPRVTIMGNVVLRIGGGGLTSKAQASSFTSFSENEVLENGSRPPAWFALDECPTARVLCGNLDALDLSDDEALSAGGGQKSISPPRTLYFDCSH